jgi:hypothetical protein
MVFAGVMTPGIHGEKPMPELPGKSTEKRDPVPTREQRIDKVLGGWDKLQARVAALEKKLAGQTKLAGQNDPTGREEAEE